VTKTLVEAKRLSNPLLKSKIINYVITRQNEDGGYCFAQGALESSSQDTFYGLAILQQLNATYPNPDKTLVFLNENRIDSIYSMYYTAKAQLLLCKCINQELKADIKLLLKSSTYYGSRAFFTDISELTTTQMALELADLLKVDVSSMKIAEWLCSFQNSDGGYGPNNVSNIESTYHALACLSLLGKQPTQASKTLKFIRMCEKPCGGFTVIPVNLMPYMEYSYAGILALELFNEKSKYPLQTIEWVLSCQRYSGGFARSDLGIATFVDTYDAIQIIKKLEHS
jgi:hypothetical protein